MGQFAIVLMETEGGSNLWTPFQVAANKILGEPVEAGISRDARNRRRDFPWSLNANATRPENNAKDYDECQFASAKEVAHARIVNCRRVIFNSQISIMAWRQCGWKTQGPSPLPSPIEWERETS